ncbi:hypothetical protein [Phocaeicola faecicola]|uniref:hypothetical protein n=1 Tax=Phocaeicola faecicola TaxID=2739389 RepID=UPI002A824BB9|nr:hypothetical protein [Phocaeicola faecicola]MDY4871994.1 hypothetical protein [Phocaeicola faecicola]
MKNNWLEIYDILSYCINNGVMESTYQREIENCFKILGWRKTNSTLQSQVTIPIGSNHFIRPDIVLQKENENGNIVPIIAVEIKRPDNIKSERQELQLFSYMRQLRLNFGLYIGEKIQLYYDTQDNKENPLVPPMPVMTVNIKDTDNNGEVFCNLFAYEQCSSEKMESYCKELLKRKQEYTRFKERMSDFMQEAEENVKELIKNMLLSEGFTEERIDKELTKIDIQVNIKTSEIKTQQAIQYPVSVTKKHISKNNNTHKRDRTQFSFDGGVKYYNKRKFVLEIIKDYIQRHPEITFNDMEKVFYPEIHSRSRGVIKRYEEVQQMIKESEDIKTRYFLDAGEIITLSDGTQIAVNNQWGTRFPYFLNAIKDIYTVISNSEYKV